VKTKIQKAINDKITGNEVFSQEFQDKYFLIKKIKRALPEFSDDILFETINICNEKLKSPCKKNDFVNIFSKTLKRLSDQDNLLLASRSDKEWPWWKF